MSINAIILAGGLGTRLDGIVDDDIPKALIKVNKKPFITYLFDQLLKAKINRVIICTGYLSGKFPDTLGHQYKKLEIIYSTETEPLGTGGAIANATNLILSDKCLVMNGDSYINTHLDKFIAWHEKNEYRGSILVTNAKKENRYGNIKLSTAGRIKEFSEKDDIKGKKCINAGVYILNMELIHDISLHRNVSLERDCFPFWIEDGLGGFYRRAKFIDIGTPETFNNAQQFFKRKKRKK